MATFTSESEVKSMSALVNKISNMLDMLPESDQHLAYEIVKKMVLAWDSDFTKLTPAERKSLDAAELDFQTGNTVKHEEINWN